MDALADLLQTETTLWAAGVIGIVVGLLIGILLGIAVSRRRPTGLSDADNDAPRSGKHPAADNEAVTDLAIRFIDSADTAHNTLLTVDRRELADTELEDALHSDNPSMRRLAEAITTLAGIHNELRVRAPKKTLDTAESLFTHVTYSAMDGIRDEDGFSTDYQGRKTAFIDAVRGQTGV